MCSPSSILCLHVLIHKISTICILVFLLFGLVLILAAILTPHSLCLSLSSKLFQLFRTNCSNIPALKHLRSLTQFKSTKGPVDTKRIYGTMVATKKGRAGRVGKLGNYNQMMNLRFTWANPAALSRSQFVLRRPCKGSHSARYTQFRIKMISLCISR